MKLSDKRMSLLAIGMVLLSACSQEEVQTHDAQPRPIKLVTVERATNEVPVSYPAVIEAAQTSQLTFQVSGLLQELPVLEGDEVKKGDLIAKLDQRDFKNNLNAAKAEYENAESAYSRAARLFKKDAISQSVVEQRQSVRDIAKARMDTTVKALADTELRAPFDGVVASLNVENFQNVGAQQPVLTLQSDRSVEAVINVPAQVVAYIPQLEPINTSVTLDAASGTSIPAQLKEASGTADPQTQTYRVRFSFNPPEDLWILPGMTGKVTSTLVYKGQEINTDVSVPVASVLSQGDQKFVWIVDEATMTVSKRHVELADDQTGKELSIIKGLNAGETIAGAGASYLFEGTPVRAWSKAGTQGEKNEPR